MTVLFTYIIPVDDGAAPNPFHNICSLAICKPVIRRTANVGDWVAAFGSRRAPSGNLEGRLVYAMKVEEILTLAQYDQLAQQKWPGKIPKFKSSRYPEHLGDCIYDYSANLNSPELRTSVHKSDNRETDLRGINVLLSKRFYYFGKKAKLLPKQFMKIVHQGQGHRKIADTAIIRTFENWVSKFKTGRHGEPDYKIGLQSTGTASHCRARCGKLDRCKNC